MAALCTGNYGLTQNRADDSKEYFFVKLTDSALRAVEEYQRNQNKCNTHATIQIIGSGGVLSFPTAVGNVGQFSFSIDDIEGSFECIRQTQNQLDVLGALPYKMRIHANDDVYETTRYRMAVAEENQKNKCTREIKPNQTDIGRKVKLKTSSNRLTNIPPKRDQITNSSQSPLTSSNSMNPISSGSTSVLSSITNNGISSSPTLIANSSSLTSSGSQNSSINLKNSGSVSSANNLNNLGNSSAKLHSAFNPASSNLSVSAASSLSSALSSAAGSGTSGINSGYYNNNSTGQRTAHGLSSNSSSLSGSQSRRGTAGINSSSNRNQKNGSRHTPDITKRKIRERLIHLLALKPFKKPELYTRLQNEGIRDRERMLITSILQEISTMRDNTYNLKRQIWNDVNEDWPFYTEQELQMLKRRKPQNLTPPLSSDGGSSTSGQSPTSTHNGSPPPAVKRPSLDRDRFYEEPTSKKQRISHFRKEPNEVTRRGGATNSRDSYNMNSRSRDNHDMRSSSYYGSNTTYTKHHHDTEENPMGLSYSVLGTEAAQRISRDDVVNGHSKGGHHQSNTNSSSHHIHHVANINNSNKSGNIGGNSNTSSKRSPLVYNNHHNPSSNKTNLGSDIRRQCSSPITAESVNMELGLNLPGADTQRCSPGIQYSEIDHSTTNSNKDNNRSNNNGEIGGPFKNNKYDFSRFTKIMSIEQRRLYKTEFENDYTEYRELLNIIESVGQRFKVFAERLDHARNNEAYRVIKRQIVAEYEKINRDQEHQKAKARFDFLHAKLAHIKALVSEFDKTLTADQATNNALQNPESCQNYNANRSRSSPSQNNGTSLNVHMSNGSNINGMSTTSSSSLRTSPLTHCIPPYSMSSSSGSSNLDHLPKSENY